MKDGFELRNVEGKGDGIFATRVFKAGETVMIGEIKKILNNNDSHASQIGKHKFVRHGGLITKVNHSCEPNCGIRVNELSGHDFVAMRTIDINEEITFDYAMRNYSVEYFPPKCICGSELCRERVTGWQDLPETRKNAYKGFVAPYLYELDTETV